jgi:hypothetical protein
VTSAATRIKPVRLAILHYLADEVDGQEMLSRIIGRFRNAGMELAFSGLNKSVISVRSCTAHLVLQPPIIGLQESSMFPIIRVRRDARALCRTLRSSLASPDETWKVGADEDGHPTLSNANFRIVLMPRTIRLFDAIHVYSNDAEIWLPFLPRVRLRAAARVRLIHDATENWRDSKVKKPRVRRRAKRAA